MLSLYSSGSNIYCFKIESKKENWKEIVDYQYPLNFDPRSTEDVYQTRLLDMEDYEFCLWVYLYSKSVCLVKTCTENIDMVLNHTLRDEVW